MKARTSNRRCWDLALCFGASAKHHLLARSFMSLRLLSLIAASALVTGLSGGPACAQSPSTNVMFIFDASGSMKRAAGNESRMSVAKRTFGETLAAMPKEVQTGLLVFGHRRRNDCSDIEVVSPIGADSAASQSQMVSGFEAVGETPIAAAITRAGQALRAFKGQQNSIVLVTDEIEECRGDPCAAACRPQGPRHRREGACGRLRARCGQRSCNAWSTRPAESISMRKTRPPCGARSRRCGRW